jgi:uncharacterized protein YbbK (DUF523 family)
MSKCIGFDPCRYNGEIVQDKFVRHLEPHVAFDCICPGAEIGLGTPRAPVRVVSSGGSFELIQPASGLDVSDKMREFSRGFLDGLKEVDGFILKNRLLSCGFTDVPTPCAKSVPEPDLFMPSVLALSEKQIPQITENTEKQKKLMELLESDGARPSQALHCHENVIVVVTNRGKMAA